MIISLKSTYWCVERIHTFLSSVFAVFIPTQVAHIIPNTTSDKWDLPSWHQMFPFPFIQRWNSKTEMNGKFSMMSGEITHYRLCFYAAKISISQYDVTRDNVFQFWTWQTAALTLSYVHCGIDRYAITGINSICTLSILIMLHLPTHQTDNTVDTSISHSVSDVWSQFLSSHPSSRICFAIVCRWYILTPL